MSLLPSFPDSHLRLPSPARAKRVLALGFLSLLLPSLAVRAQTTTPTCSPGVREIFDFQVGDIFQYRIYKPSVEPTVQTVIVRKYKVASRNESGFIRTYDYSGIESESTLQSGVLVGKSYRAYRETRAFLDTAHSPFNGCAGEIVAMTSDPDLDTRVEAFQGDTSLFPLARPGLSMKSYGRVLGQKQDTAVLPVEDVVQRETYAEGLGLVSGSYGGYPIPPTTYSLVGYVKGGDTVGVVSPDSSFWHTTGLKSPAAHRTGPVGIPAGGAEDIRSAYDAQGRQIGAMEKGRRPSAATPRFRK